MLDIIPGTLAVVELSGYPLWMYSTRSTGIRVLRKSDGARRSLGWIPFTLRPIDAERFYRGMEGALTRAQRSRKRTRIKAIHARIANCSREGL